MAPPAVLLFASAAILTVLASFPAARLARARGMVSAPGTGRAGPGGVPLLGGLAVVAGLLGAALLAVVLGMPGARPLAAWAPALALLAGFALIGAVDDRRGLDPFTRLLGEILVAAVALRLACMLVGGPCARGPFTILLGALALTAAANAYNLTDNADGVAAGTGLLTLLALALMQVPGVPGALWPAAAGALFGFLLLNRPPARIYLGDLGSLAAGGLIGLGLWQRWIAAPAPSPLREALALLLALGYTAFDPVYAVARRALAGRAPWVGGCDHPSHDLAALTRSRPAALSCILLAHAISVAGALALARGRPLGPPIAAAAIGWTALFAAARIGARRRAGTGNRAGTQG
jgi:UDP-GlcNAc:undecaprenyl-phosphate/decaprenyl-phosphate GlcNAc-1-phosphate transferase